MMKVIRIRSDRFDPLTLERDAPNPLAALTNWIRKVQQFSNARCEPSRDILKGSFARFASLESYEREVLQAVREIES